ncbi:hypothetical protein AB990_11165 [Alkalihalobacillus pseudalcaliphilus]|nr:hypothetical protein AB990_11165 [Alkalihalobacillus pseudalcaliphilus]
MCGALNLFRKALASSPLKSGRATAKCENPQNRYGMKSHQLKSESPLSYLLVAERQPAKDVLYQSGLKGQ